MVLKFHSDDTITKSGFRAILTGIFYKKNILPFFTHYWFEIGVPAKRKNRKKHLFVCENRVQILAFFRETFRLLETLVWNEPALQYVSRDGSFSFFLNDRFVMKATTKKTKWSFLKKRSFYKRSFLKTIVFKNIRF